MDYGKYISHFEVNFIYISYKNGAYMQYNAAYMSYNDIYATLIYAIYKSNLLAN